MQTCSPATPKASKWDIFKVVHDQYIRYWIILTFIKNGSYKPVFEISSLVYNN